MLFHSYITMLQNYYALYIDEKIRFPKITQLLRRDESVVKLSAGEYT